MSNRKLLILAGIVTVLSFILFGNQLLAALGITNSTQNRFFPDSVQAATISTITIKHSDGNEISLTKTANGWMVNNFVGSPDIETFIDGVASLTASSLTSKSENNFDLFEVTEDTATHLTVTLANGSEHTVLIGRAASTPNSFYVRRPGELAVYTVYGAIRGRALQGVDDWRERVLVQLSEDQVKSIGVTNGDNSYVTSKNDESTWSLQYRGISARLSDAARNRLFTTLLRVEAQGFDAETTPASVQAAADAQITITGANNGEEIRMWLQRNDAGWSVSITGSEYVYTFAEHAFQYILVDPTSMH